MGNALKKPKAKPSLDWLLKEATSLWITMKRPNETYDFTLGKFPSGWTFKVINSWHRWMDMGLRHQFGPHPTPEAAIEEFLRYVADNQIHVDRLQQP